jgi:hypothetical protein
VSPTPFFPPGRRFSNGNKYVGKKKEKKKPSKMVASSVMTGTSYGYVRREARVHRYHWPAIQLNVWMLVMLAASLCIIGIFGTFVTVQKQLLLGIPW